MHPVIPILQLLRELSRVDGRKKFQKTVHILKELGAPFQERFEYSYYGMYSAQLKGELDALEREGLLKERETLTGANTTYVIESTPELGKLLGELGLETPPAWVEVAKQLNKLSSQVLEGISTILFLRKTETDDAVVRQRLLVLKPHLASVADNCLVEVGRLPKPA
ncbi:MAG: hypothetical protein HOP33_16520 [Verrucomicrobia bacterium]|nr:hypothetical protein [Verrucomicrobiota bacterium]